MRIALISPLELRVPPEGYGGTELIVSLLAEELVKRGHQVTLYATGDSVTSARLRSVYPHKLRGSGRDKGIWTMINAAACMQEAEQFDIIHNHTLFEGFSLANLVKTPVLSTLHGPLSGDWLDLFEHYGGYYNTISRSAKRSMSDKGYVGVVYN